MHAQRQGGEIRAPAFIWDGGLGLGRKRTEGFMWPCPGPVPAKGPAAGVQQQQECWACPVPPVVPCCGCRAQCKHKQCQFQLRLAGTCPSPLWFPYLHDVRKCCVGQTGVQCALHEGATVIVFDVPRPALTLQADTRCKALLGKVAHSIIVCMSRGGCCAAQEGGAGKMECNDERCGGKGMLNVQLLLSLEVSTS
jgi:hypothetical protein